jgi:RHS repeat-associated protein
MAGISSKAAGVLENKKKYNGIEFENDLDLNVYDAQFRELDAQTGRWWQIDPKTDEMYMWSTYASNFDNPIRYEDKLGDEPNCCKELFNQIVTAVETTVEQISSTVAGAANAYGSDQVLGAGNMTAAQAGIQGENASFYSAGQTVGHVAAIVTGLAETIVGGGGEIASLGIATPVAIPLALHGVSVMATASSKLLTQGSSSSNTSTERGKNNRQPDQTATGDHSVSNGRGSTTYEKNNKNPTGFQETKRVDTKGGSHNGVPTPHVHENGKVRPAKPNDIPNTDLSKNKKP